jgi:hypothetical protein
MFLKCRPAALCFKKELSRLPDDDIKRQLTSRLAAVESGQRDLLF